MKSRLLLPRPLLLALSMLAGITGMPAVEFRILNWGSGWDDSLRYRSGQSVEPVVANEGTLSRPYHLETGPLVLFRELKKGDEIVRETVAAIPLPADLAQGILVLVPKDEQRTGYDGFWMDDSVAARPPGMIEFRNFSRIPVALKVAGREIMLPARAKASVPFPPGARRIPFQAAAQVDGEWEFLGASPLPVRTGYRVLVMMRDGRASAGRDTRAIDMLSFYDPPPPLDPEAAPPLASVR